MKAASEYLFGVRIDLYDYSDLDRCIDAALIDRAPLFLTAPHFHILLIARRETWLRTLLNTSSVNYIDGIGTWLGICILSGHRAPRINGTDYHHTLLQRSLADGWRVFLLGGDENTAKQLALRLRKQFPHAALEVQPGTIDIADDSVVEAIRSFHPDLLFLGLGTPLQFEWMHRHATALTVPVILATGAFLDFAAGTRPRAPRWMRRIGLEWLHRLLHEPRRLWRRYILGIPAFVFLVLRERLRRN
ncbi:MAG: WecB/TagA/CpsF family glycosyltransferase [Bacteroidetes bacterium]|nr:WecB/TagA/CpsF family glycosyltransferase [Bacteroidota bacterium]